MPNTVAGWGVGGGTPGAPPSSPGNINEGLGSLVSDNPRPVSLRPGAVLTGVVNAFGGNAPLGAIPLGGKVQGRDYGPQPTPDTNLVLTTGTPQGVGSMGVYQAP